MRFILLGFCVLLFIVSIGHGALGVEIEGKVVEATDSTATIEPAAGALPNVGDPVQIFFSVAGLKDKVQFAAGKVKAIKGRTVVVVIESKKGNVVAGLNATIQCTTPRLLVCTLSRDGNPEQVLIRDDGIEVKRLTNSKGRDVYAAWSPDGTKIVYFSGSGSARGLYVLDANGENARRLTTGRDEGAAWSPDGKTIVFTHYLEAYVSQLIAITFDDEGLAGLTGDAAKAQRPKYKWRELTDGTAYDADPAWSPDGKTIAFASDRGSGWRLCLMDADGKNVRRISAVDSRFANYWPAWSPDGKRIAYADGADDDTLQIFTSDPDGKNRTQLTKDGIFNTYVAWSPDGKRLAYMKFTETDRKGSVVIMDADGANAKVILSGQGAGHNGRLAWKPR